jgi:ferredoxin
MTYRITLDRTLCSGFGACVGLAPDAFRLDRDGRASAVVDLTEDARVVDAAAGCPMAAIEVVEERAA